MRSFPPTPTPLASERLAAKAPCMTPATPATRDVLTQVEAEARAARVAQAAYTIALDLVKGSPTYKGDVTVTFPATGDGPLFLDFRGKEITLLEVNGSAQEPDWTGYRLTLPANSLTADNTVRVIYENEYDHTGDGFHQFIDPQDGEEYLYSNFEPYEAHRLFPCFDQPDIKATYDLSVVAPAEWEVIANSRQAATLPLGDGRVKHIYAKTQPFSTYLFCIVAGPYQAFTSQHGSIPLGLYCRRSLAQYFDTEEVFTITRQGLDFYADFFGYPYPFDKYDQLFVPEFNAGAMENVGCVTHNEFMVFRDPPTENQRRERAEVVLHEMAHMWFGDLVTMKWWNDLWLNESFATYMSYLCMTGATRFTSGWQEFNSGIKNWAYRQDQLVTTHPISGTVADTDETFLNFDGITYGKGASVLKQLVAAIGMDGFKAGMQHYFATHAWGNTTLPQFLAALETGSGVELQEWSKAWLETASLNTIAATWEADGERLTSLKLTQTAPADYPTIRPHTLEIGLVREEDGVLVASSVPATIRTAETEIEAARGQPKPALVFPNYNDHAYAKVALDSESVAFTRDNIERITDPMLRQLLWSSLWNMTRDQQLKSTEFLAIVREKIAFEASIELVDAILTYAGSALMRYVPDEWREREAQLLFDAAWANLRAVDDGDRQIIWTRALISFAVTPGAIALLGRLMDGEESVPGVTLDQDMRWAIATKFVSYGVPGGMERLAKEREADPSDRGQRAMLTGETAQPDATVKAAAWERFHAEGYGSAKLTRSAMAGFNHWRQKDLLQGYYEAFFDRVPEVFQRPEKETATDYFATLWPSYRVEQGTLDRAQRVLDTHGPTNTLLARTLREAMDELERAMKCRQFAQG